MHYLIPRGPVCEYKIGVVGDRNVPPPLSLVPAKPDLLAFLEILARVLSPFSIMITITITITIILYPFPVTPLCRAEPSGRAW